VRKNSQRTGIFDLENMNPIELKTINPKNENNEPLITAPTIMIDVNSVRIKGNRISAYSALIIVKEQMRLSGIRKQTIKEYDYNFRRLLTKMNVEYLDEITAETLFGFISSLGDVKDVTKQSKLRVIKAILNRMFDNGWIEKRFWKDIKIKVDGKIKPPANENNLAILLSLLNMSNFIHFRDAVSILTIYKCGLRMSTLIQLEEKHIDFDNRMLIIEGDIMKGRDVLKLPFDDELEMYLKRLIKQNDVIRNHYKKRNKYIFISKFGDSLDVESKPCAITKRLSYYSSKYQLKDINPHAIRRLFATNLLRKGANVALISKALSHKSLATTTAYLGLTTDEVANELKEFL